MQFTEEDIPLMKLIFNPETHAMGMMVGQERADKIFKKVCAKRSLAKHTFNRHTSHFYHTILCDKKLSTFFFKNNILDLKIIYYPHIYWILDRSPIAKDIWNSRKLNLSLLSEEQLDYFKQKFEK